MGGQDIKLIVLKDGRVKDFKLNTQCSAGNGYFLQSTAEGFGMKVEEFADLAFSAKSMPSFGYGCAVFMQSDIVNFQRQGWRSEEILAGLADVLPKECLPLCRQHSEPRIAGHAFRSAGRNTEQSGRRQGRSGLHRSSFRANGKEPEIIVHEHCGESGAIGAAQEALRLWRNGNADHIHRSRSRREYPLPHHTQRRYALLLLQEQLPAHLHRRGRDGATVSGQSIRSAAGRATVLPPLKR